MLPSLLRADCSKLGNFPLVSCLALGPFLPLLAIWLTKILIGR
jgi:hypothetical protein